MFKVFVRGVCVLAVAAMVWGTGAMPASAAVVAESTKANSPASAPAKMQVIVQEGEWALPAFGAKAMPSGLSIAYVPDILKYADTKEEKPGGKNPQAQVVTIKDGKKLPTVEELKNLPFTIGMYQLTHNDGQSYRQSYAFILQMKEPSNETRLLFDGSPNIVKENLVAGFDKMFQDAARGVFADKSLSDSGSELLEIEPLSIFAVGDAQTGVKSGIRCMLNMEGIKIPLRLQGYASADKDGKPVILAVMVTDSERDFWIPMLDGLITGK